jgi:hypothetical protein
MNTCEFCNKVLSTKSTLSRHLTICKIKKQNENENNNTTVVSCEFCNKVLANHSALKRHLSTCKIKKEKDELNTERNKNMLSENLLLKEKVRCMSDEIIALKEKVNGLQEQNKVFSDQMFQLANKPTTTNKQIVKKQINLLNNLAPYDISERLVQQIVDKEYTEDDFRQGPGRLASFVATKIATNQDGKKKIVCTDYARRRFKHLNGDGSDVIEDIGAIHLCKTITKPMKKVISTTYDKIKEELIDEVDIDSYRTMYMTNTARLRQPEFVCDLAKHMINPDDESNINGEEEEEMLLLY